MEKCLQGKQLDLTEFFPSVAERHSCAKPGLMAACSIGTACAGFLQLLSIEFKFPVLQFPSPLVGIAIKELRSSISPSCKVLDVSREGEAENCEVIKKLHRLRKPYKCTSERLKFNAIKKLDCQ